jgi:hypothetical protein
MKTSTTILVGLGVAGAGVGGWVAFRQFVRVKTREVLIEEYGFDDFLSKARDAETAARFLTANPNFTWNLPTLDELVVSLVPIWDTVLPDAAFKDILEKGRKSKYWPEQHKKAVNEKVEREIFRALRAAAETPEGASTQDMLIAAGSALIRGK